MRMGQKSLNGFKFGILMFSFSEWRHGSEKLKTTLTIQQKRRVPLTEVYVQGNMEMKGFKQVTVTE